MNEDSAMEIESYVEDNFEMSSYSSLSNGIKEKGKNNNEKNNWWYLD